MKKLLLREAAKHKLQNRRRKRWQKTVSILACLVVFCTVYALILPALTAEADTYCGKEEHTHTEACYEDKLICGKEEGQGAHHHTDDCYREVEALVCPTPESDGHQHTEACYTEEQVLTCTNTDEGHVHSEFDSCYTTEKKLTCGMEEGQGAHHHTAECYETKKELICGQEENDGHRHTAECYEKELICGKEEHSHTLACYSNPDADVESGDVWQNTVSSVTLTGNWGADLAAIAQTQTGYTESTANYAVAEDGQTIHGYTRYGAWANDPYRDNWSAQFADFCLSYAGVPTSAVPQNSDCSAWNYTIPDGYTPKTGDLLLLDTDNNGSADHAGIVITADDSALTAIVGDADKAVRNNTYNIGSENIKGYVSIPENPALADDNNEEETTETTPAPEVTEEPQETPTPEVTPEAEPTQEPEPTPEVTEEPTQESEATPEVTEEPTQEPENKADDTANNIEVTPTPTITPETMQEVQLEQQTVTAELYTDSTYATAEQSENAVVVSGNLPENGIVKAFPVNNISVEGMKVLCAWDITIFDAEGNKWEPAEGNTLSVKFQIPNFTENENKASAIYYIPDESMDKPQKLDSEVTEDGISFDAEHFSIYTLLLADNNSNDKSAKINGLDLNNYITTVTMQKKDGQTWKDADSFTTDDQARAEIKFAGIDPNKIKNNGYKAYIKVPGSIDCSKFTERYELKDGNKVAGTYTYEKGEDGQWYIVINCNKSYVDAANSNIGGDINLFFQWDKSSVSGEGEKTNVQIGSWNGEIEIKKGNKDNQEEDGDKYGVYKTAGEVRYGENGKTYIDYTISLKVKKSVQAPITLSDELKSQIFSYTDQLSIEPSSYSVCFTNKKNSGDTKTTDIKIGNDGEMISAGDYTIKYSVSADISANATVSESLHNTISIMETDQKKDVSEITKEVKTNVISKTGTAKEEEGTQYVDWIVYLNKGTYIQNLTSPLDFSDNIPTDQELFGTIKVSKYNENNALVGSKNITPDETGRNIIYTTDTGRFYYKIEYRTKVIKDLTIGSNEVQNTGIVTGGMEGEDTGKVTINKHILSKSAGDHLIRQENDKWYIDIEWTSKINSSDLKGYVYTDWAGSSNTSMTDTLREEIKVYDTSATEVSKDQYTVESYSKKDNEEKEVGLFKLTFKADCNVTGPVTIKYKTTTDLTDMKTGTYPQIWNYAAVGDSAGQKDTTLAQKQFYYTHGDITRVVKYNDQWDSSGKGEMTLKPGDHIIPWTVQMGVANLKGNLTIVDIIPAGLILDEDSLVLELNGGYPNYQKVVTPKEDGTTELKITIEKNAYKPNDNVSGNMSLKYNTEIDPDSDFYKGNTTSTSFTNTVNVTDDKGSTDSTRTETVTRQIVGKTGSYDSNNNFLTYDIVVNPDASTLTSENKLEVVDTLNAGPFGEHIELISLKLFTAVKNTDENGKTSIVPGSWIRDMEENDSGNLYTYTYNSATNEFKGFLPDSTACVLVATYSVNEEASEDVTVKNSVKISGNQKWSDEDNTTKVDKFTGGHMYTSDHITIVKRDQNNYNKKLSGAKFSLWKYNPDNNNWILVNGELNTGNDGSVIQGEANLNVLYKLVETAAPVEYKLDSTPYYFLASKDNNYTLPDRIIEDGNYSKNKVDIKTYSSDKSVNIVIDRFDLPDTTVVKPGQIRVNKKWVGSNDQEITDSIELSKMPDVKVTLTKNAPEMFAVRFNGSMGMSKIIKVPKNATVIVKGFNANYPPQITGNCTPKLLNNENTNWQNWFYLEQIGSDLVVELPQIYINDSFTYEIDTTSIDSQKVSSQIGNVITLNSLNDWSYLWTNLETGDGITYTVVEENIDGYTTSYTVDSKKLDEGKDFSLCESGSKVTITNKATPTYILPETGGIGTNRFTAVGLALMAGSLMCGYVMRRKCREGRRN